MMQEGAVGIKSVFTVVLALLHLFSVVAASKSTSIFSLSGTSFRRTHHLRNQTPTSIHGQNSKPRTTYTALLCLRGGDIQTINSLSEIKSILDDNDASSPNDLVVLDFASNNCPPCEMIAPIYKDLSNLEEFANVTFCKVNVSHHPDVAENYGVDGWPTFLLFKDGEIVDSVVGGQAAKAGLYGLVAKNA